MRKPGLNAIVDKSNIDRKPST